MTPLPWTRALNDVLADLYPTVNDSSRIVHCAGMRSALVRYNDAALVNWFNILDEAEKQGRKIRAVLDCAIADYPDHPVLLALKHGEPTPVRGPDLKWEAPQDGAHFEKITGAKSTLLPISFLEVGMQRSRSVARVLRADHSSGTSFLIGGGWLLTNNHVLPSAESARDASAEFNYQLMPDGTSAPIKKYPLDTTRFMTSKENDWTAIGIDDSAEQEWGVIHIAPAQAVVNAFVNIIQHPGGGPNKSRSTTTRWHTLVMGASNTSPIPFLDRQDRLSSMTPGGSSRSITVEVCCVNRERRNRSSAMRASMSPSCFTI